MNPPLRPPSPHRSHPCLSSCLLVLLLAASLLAQSLTQFTLPAFAKHPSSSQQLLTLPGLEDDPQFEQFTTCVTKHSYGIISTEILTGGSIFLLLESIYTKLRMRRAMDEISQASAQGLSAQTGNEGKLEATKKKLQESQELLEEAKKDYQIAKNNWESNGESSLKEFG